MTMEFRCAMMLNRLRNRDPYLPRSSGEGMLFAFSGLDGPTCTRSEFVAAVDRRPFDLLLHTRRRRRFSVGGLDEVRIAIATGDVLAGSTAGGEALLTWAAWHTLVGILPTAASARLMEEDFSSGEGMKDGGPRFPSASGADGAVVLRRHEERMALAWGTDVQEAERRAEAGLALDPWLTAEERLSWYDRLPPSRNGSPELLNKCASVMRVNALGPEGCFPGPWSTPDRVPHRHAWLWDSCLQSLGMNHVDPNMAFAWLRAILANLRADGFAVGAMSVDGPTSQDHTQPPMLAWAVLENLRSGGDRAAAAWAVPRLAAYLDWDLTRRDRAGLLQWHLETHIRGRCNESLDNSPRFDAHVPMAHVDFSVFAAHDLYCLAQLCRELGDDLAAARHQERAQRLSSAVHARLWNSQHGIYEDLADDGLSGVRAVTGFFPLLLPDLPAAHCDALVRTLEDPAHFAGPAPVPTVAYSHPAWSTDMWRGPMWLMTNYPVIAGLRRRGRREAAARLAEATVAAVGRWYRRYGVLFEFYDSRDQVAPADCARKGPAIPVFDYRIKFGCVRDYHSTAALTACLLWEDA